MSALPYYPQPTAPETSYFPVETYNNYHTIIVRLDEMDQEIAALKAEIKTLKNKPKTKHRRC